MDSPQKQFLSSLCASNKGAIIVGSIGTISYDLSEIEHPHKVLIRGAMGAALGCGLGMALSTTKDVIVVIGDGSFLMQMGAMSTILKHNLPNLRVVIINNNSYRSCGGQSTNFSALPPLPFEVYDLQA
jgi:sulfopyruvate decarboxylase subunit beta